MITFDICEGNQGCFAFLMEAIFKVDGAKAERAVERMNLFGIRGSNLYILWNDCCNRQTAFTLNVMLYETLEEIRRHIFQDVGRGIPYTEEEKAVVLRRANDRI